MSAYIHTPHPPSRAAPLLCRTHARALAYYSPTAARCGASVPYARARSCLLQPYGGALRRSCAVRTRALLLTTALRRPSSTHARTIDPDRWCVRAALCRFLGGALIDASGVPSSAILNASIFGLSAASVLFFMHNYLRLPSASKELKEGDEAATATAVGAGVAAGKGQGTA